jgi:hypothetical protein
LHKSVFCFSLWICAGICCLAIIALTNGKKEKWIFRQTWKSDGRTGRLLLFLFCDVKSDSGQGNGKGRRWNLAAG